MARSSTSNVGWWMSKSSSEPGFLVPSLASAPGIDSRYQAKSSPPRLCGAGVIASGAEHPLGGRVDHRRGHGLVDGGRHVPHVGQVREHAVGAGHRLDQRLEQVRRGVPGLVVEAPHGALDDAVVRDRVGRRARAHPAPDQAEAGPRVDPAGQRGRQLGDDLAEREDQVGGQVRPGGVPAGPGDPDRDLVAGRGDRADPWCRSCRRRAAGRSAARRSGPRTRCRPPRARRAHRPAPPRPAGRSAGPGRAARPAAARAGQEQAGAEQDRGVHVVPAGVAGVRPRWTGTGRSSRR